MTENNQKRNMNDLSAEKSKEQGTYDPYEVFRIPEEEEIVLYDEEGYVNQEGIEKLKSLNLARSEERLPFSMFPDSIKSNFITRLAFAVGTVFVGIFLKVMLDLGWIMLIFIFGLAIMQFISFMSRYYYVSSQQFYVMKGTVTNMLQKGIGSNKYNLIQISDGSSFLSFDAPLKNTPIRVGIPITLYIAADTEVSENEFGDYIHSYLSIEYHVKN